MKIKFSGHSDDIVGFDIDRKSDEWGCYESDDQKDIHLVARITSIGGTQGCLVRAIYDGCWSFAVGQIEDGRTLPRWTFRLGQEHEYSTYLEIDTGDELVEVVRVKADKKNGGWIPVKADD